MNDPETGELFNKVITRLAPEALRIMWPEIKPTVEVQIKNVSCPSILNKTTLKINLNKFEVGIIEHLFVHKLQLI